jgi:hypothetical protein
MVPIAVRGQQPGGRRELRLLEQRRQRVELVERPQQARPFVISKSFPAASK